MTARRMATMAEGKARLPAKQLQQSDDDCGDGGYGNDKDDDYK